MLKNKNTVITGATEGIGLSIAEMFVKNGANVCLIARNYERLIEVQKKLSVYGTNVHIIAADLSSSPKEVGKRVQDVFSSINVLVNNAGIARFKAFEKIEPEDFDLHINLNIRAPFYLTQQLLSSLEKSEGSVINISSYFSQRMLLGRDSSVYSATKGAINSLTKALAFELGKKRIRVNVIAPGSINTKQFQSNLEQLSSEKREAFHKMVTDIYPLGKIGESEDIANMAVFLASDRAKWITGSIISVDGGLTTN